MIKSVLSIFKNLNLKYAHQPTLFFFYLGSKKTFISSISIKEFNSCFVPLFIIIIIKHSTIIYLSTARLYFFEILPCTLHIKQITIKENFSINAKVNIIKTKEFCNKTLRIIIIIHTSEKRILKIK